MRNTFLFFILCVSFSVQAKMLDPICTYRQPFRAEHQDISQEKCIEKVIDSELVKYKANIGTLLTAKNISYDWLAKSNYNPLLEGTIYSFTAEGYNIFKIEYTGSIMVHIESDIHPKTHKKIYSCGTLDSRMHINRVVFQLVNEDGKKIFYKTGSYRCS